MFNIISAPDRDLEIVDRPELSADRARGRPKQIAGRIVVQVLRQVFNLQRGEFGAIAARALIDQPVQRVVLIGAAPLHQTGAATPGNLFNVGDGTSVTIESHRLIAGCGCGPLCIRCKPG
jgi:hypothetical protein